MCTFMLRGPPGNFWGRRPAHEAFSFKARPRADEDSRTFGKLARVRPVKASHGQPRPARYTCPSQPERWALIKRCISFYRDFCAQNAPQEELRAANLIQRRPNRGPSKPFRRFWGVVGKCVPITLPPVVIAWPHIYVHIRSPRTPIMTRPSAVEKGELAQQLNLF